MTTAVQISPETPPSAVFCPCGSGLRSEHCCSLAYPVAPVTGEHVDRAAARLDRAAQQEDRAEIRAATLALLEIDPGHHVGLGTLFTLLEADGAITAAGVVIDRAATLHLNNVQLRAIAAQFFVGQRDAQHALPHARMLVRLSPLDPISHKLMGSAFLESGRETAAEYHLRNALTLDADKALAPRRMGDAELGEIKAMLALALRAQGRIDEARTLYEELGKRWPRDLRLLLEWAALEEADRRFDAASALLDRAAEVAPGSPLVVAARATLLRRRNQPEAALDLLTQVADDQRDLLQRGQLLDSLGRYPEAFAAFSAFKQALRTRGGQDYQGERAERLVRELRDFFTPGRTQMLARARVRSDRPQPIFIVGFPRSGTTLLEQTLSAHPEIAAGDELTIINQIADRSPQLLGSPGDYPKALSELWLGDRVGFIDSMRDHYLNEATQMGALDPSKRWFTDKMPLNETHLGLIHLLFPESPILHLVRHPADVVLSVFSNALTHGFSCANALETAAAHYALIAGLIDHYRTVIPGLRYHAVRYEDLVADQERVVRAALAFVGADFDPATLSFHENARYARTASYAQVTEHLYDRSVYRHRHYLAELAPILPVLEPAMTRLGYAIGGAA
jgi:tetratricopeptide (TPR) repeat protein